MIFVILGMVFVGYFWWKEFMRGYRRSAGDWFGYIGMIILGGLIGVLVSTLTSLIIFCSPSVNVDYTLIDTQPIYALEDNITHNGRYYLGSGTKNGDAAYFYVIEDDWGIKIESKDTDYAYIVYDNEESPRVEIYDGKWANPFIKMLGFFNPEDRYKFYVPEGTITTNMNIDLQ